jgi:hypothetical protein
VARQRNWPVAGKVELYNLAALAFESEEPESRRRAAFSKAYDWLRAEWQVFRGAKAGTYWRFDKLFEVLTGECRGCSRGAMDLRRAYGDAAASREIVACLHRLRGIKPNVDYPWVAVSKFLHLYNPTLFPIYDLAVIWHGVANGASRADYRAFCAANQFAPSERSGLFNRNYTLWAAELVAGADKELMPLFADWFRGLTRGVADPRGVREAVGTYYATAFEHIAIGAAVLEGWQV